MDRDSVLASITQCHEPWPFGLSFAFHILVLWYFEFCIPLLVVHNPGCLN